MHKFLLIGLTAFILTASPFFASVQTVSAANETSGSNSLITILFSTFKALINLEFDDRMLILEDVPSEGMKIGIGPGTFKDPGIRIKVVLKEVELITDASPIDGEIYIVIGMSLKDIGNLFLKRQLEITLYTGQSGLTGLMDDKMELRDIQLILDLDKEDRADPILALAGDREISVMEGEEYDDPGASAIADYMGIAIKPNSNGIVSMGDLALPFSEDLLAMFFAPADISANVVTAVVNANGQNITDSVSHDDFYVFSASGDYKFLYNVTDNNGKSANQVERSVRVESQPEGIDDGSDVPASAKSKNDDDDDSTCFINTIF